VVKPTVILLALLFLLIGMLIAAGVLLVHWLIPHVKELPF
jgi:LPS O-antigen subunit length determinant protein (WzzB/FepE family)